jgi:hypothetical protein
MDDDEESSGLVSVRRGDRSWWSRFARDGHLETTLPLIVLSVLAISVLLYNILRTQFEPCDTSRPYAKHFYCFNASEAVEHPGFHIDTKIGGR